MSSDSRAALSAIPGGADVPTAGAGRIVMARQVQRCSNTAIAQRLVISASAVEKHISNVFTKLGLPPDDAQHRRVLAVLAYLRT
jgi:DNA-binding NarL/FixJ family response regulator